MIAGAYKREKPNGITGRDKNDLYCDCLKGSSVNSI